MATPGPFFLTGFSYFDHSLIFYAFIPALHQCAHCREHRRPFHGHDVAWCRHARMEEQQRLMTKYNQETIVPTSNQETTVPTSNQEDTVQPRNQDDTVQPCNQDDTVNQDDNTDATTNQDETSDNIPTDNDDDADDDSQRPWQTALTHPRKTISATKPQSQPSTFQKTKRKADNHKPRLFNVKNLALQTPATKKKKPTK